MTAGTSGSSRDPETREDWSSWVAATSTRNFTLGEPLLDWLDLHGEANSHTRDDARDGYEPALDHGAFLRSKGREFEEVIVRLLGARVGASNLRTIAVGPDDHRSDAKVQETLDAMRAGVSILVHPVLHDAETRTFGCPDLLVRSDVLNELVHTEVLSAAKAAESAPALGEVPWHYRVVEIKYTALKLKKRGMRSLLDSGSLRTYKVQVAIYNDALGRLQGYTPPEGYLLGRKWQAGPERGDDALDRLGAIDLDAESVLHEEKRRAVAWRRLVQTEGAQWSVLPQPSRSELWPNGSNQNDSPWHEEKREIIEELGDVTRLLGVGPKNRKRLGGGGLVHWKDPRVNAESLSIVKNADTFDRILQVNRDPQGRPVRPAIIQTNGEPPDWRTGPELEFYVDFETVTDLDDDFATAPRAGGQALLFMIGCGWIDRESDGWRFECFVTRRLTVAEERRIVTEWLAHMRAVTDERLGPGSPLPRIIHWSRAEPGFLADSHNSVASRHRDLAAELSSLPWFDFMTQVFEAEPVVVRGAFSFGLKDVARAMHELGLIQSEWEAGPGDGIGATAGAWWSEREARSKGGAMTEVPQMKGIEKYNEIDCKVMWEIVTYLRQNHTQPGPGSNSST